jgi:uncharacterized protein (DUF111 family)
MSAGERRTTRPAGDHPEQEPPVESASPAPRGAEQERYRDPVEHLCWYETIREPELEARISELAGEVERYREALERAKGILHGIPAELDHVGEDGLGNRVIDAITAMQTALAEGSRDG